MGRKTLVLGYGISGQGAANLLKAQGKEFIALDRVAKDEVELDRSDYPLENIDQIILSPGISKNHPIIQRAATMGIEVVGEIEYAFRSMQNRAIGVTGTNGKTTVTLLTTEFLNQSGIPARAVGNVGEPLSAALLKVRPDEILVIELSSYQLETVRSKKLSAAAYLNLTPDHLDRYGNMREYAKAKAKIQDCLVDEGQFFLSEDVFNDYPDLFFQRPFKMLKKVDAELDLDSIRLGLPEEENRTIAFQLASVFGAQNNEIKTFRKPKHRIEWVAEIDQVIYLDDSKGTNIDAVVYALKRLPGPIILLAGGVDKGASYAPWTALLKEKVRHMVVYGSAAEKMELELKESVSLMRKEKFADAARLAKSLASKGDIVLLSPGCSSFDQFQNYEKRGEAFQEIMRGG